MTRPKDAILGIKYGGHDTAAALFMDGRIVAACEQERYTRDKHSRNFPTEAIQDCLKIGGIGIDDVSELAFVNHLKTYIREIYLRPALESDERIGFLLEDFERVRKAFYMEDVLREHTGFKGPISFQRHHMCHVAGSYYPSGFKDALLVSFDGMGEHETGVLATGIDGHIEIVQQSNTYPNSLGLVYSAITYFLGWKNHYDEGIIMGLAPFGDSSKKIPGYHMTYYEVFEEILQETGDYTFKVDFSWLDYYNTRDKWVSEKFVAVFGQKRNHGDAITEHHKNIAAAVQDRLEAVALGQLRRARKQYGLKKLCLSGGVALNCSMNGAILKSGIFDELYVQPASGDQGTTVGICYLTHQQRIKSFIPAKKPNAYLGSRFTSEEVLQVLQGKGAQFSKPDNVFKKTAELLEEGKIIGWFQGAAEFGPRALGNRSILCRPFPASMRDHLNLRVKFREEFRPFAPSVMREHAGEYFHINQESPHMLMAVQAREETKDKIPATVHIDGSCRVQTVTEGDNLAFYRLLQAFKERTGVPVLLNTSFNVKGQPIVNSPAEAVDCFQSTKIDCLVLGEYLLEK